MAARRAEKNDLTSLLDRLSSAKYGLSAKMREAAQERAAQLVEEENPLVAAKGIEAQLEWDKLGLQRDKLVLEAMLETGGQRGSKQGVVIGGNVNVLQIGEQERAGIVAELLERARGRLAVEGNGQGADGG